MFRRFAVPNFGQVLAPLGDLFGLGTLGFSRRATPRANRPTGVGQGPRAERRRVVGGVCAARSSVNSLNSAPLCRLAPDLRASYTESVYRERPMYRKVTRKSRL